MPRAAVDDSDGIAPAGSRNLPAAVQDFLRTAVPVTGVPTAFPPNYLHGDASEIEARLAQCAPRILFRLRMWRLAPAERAKTPMPPVHALPMLGRSEAQWRDGAELARLENLCRSASPVATRRRDEQLRDLATLPGAGSRRAGP